MQLSPYLLLFFFFQLVKYNSYLVNVCLRCLQKNVAPTLMDDFQIFKNIEQHISLGSEEKKIFTSAISIKEVVKKELILRQGDQCKKLYFVESGSLRAFHINDDGRESTIMFAIQDWWITDMYSFLYQKPALLSIQAIQASRLISIEFNKLEELYKQVPKLERFFRILFQKAYVREQLRALDNISISTEQRYASFLKKFPQVAKQITQKQIASYLGITPQFLSTIKKK